MTSSATTTVSKNDDKKTEKLFRYLPDNDTGIFSFLYEDMEVPITQSLKSAKALDTMKNLQIKNKKYIEETSEIAFNSQTYQSTTSESETTEDWLDSVKYNNRLDLNKQILYQYIPFDTNLYSNLNEKLRRSHDTQQLYKKQLNTIKHQEQETLKSRNQLQIAIKNFYKDPRDITTYRILMRNLYMVNPKARTIINLNDELNGVDTTKGLSFFDSTFDTGTKTLAHSVARFLTHRVVLVTAKLLIVESFIAPGLLAGDFASMVGYGSLYLFVNLSEAYISLRKDKGEYFEYNLESATRIMQLAGKNAVIEIAMKVGGPGGFGMGRGSLLIGTQFVSMFFGIFGAQESKERTDMLAKEFGESYSHDQIGEILKISKNKWMVAKYFNPKYDKKNLSRYKCAIYNLQYSLYWTADVTGYVTKYPLQAITGSYSFLVDLPSALSDQIISPIITPFIPTSVIEREKPLYLFASHIKDVVTAFLPHTTAELFPAYLGLKVGKRLLYDQNLIKELTLDLSSMVYNGVQLAEKTWRKILLPITVAVTVIVTTFVVIAIAFPNFLPNIAKYITSTALKYFVDANTSFGKSLTLFAESSAWIIGYAITQLLTFLTGIVTYFFPDATGVWDVLLSMYKNKTIVRFILGLQIPYVTPNYFSHKLINKIKPHIDIYLAFLGTTGTFIALFGSGFVPGLDDSLYALTGSEINAYLASIALATSIGAAASLFLSSIENKYTRDARSKLQQEAEKLPTGNEKNRKLAAIEKFQYNIASNYADVFFKTVLNKIPFVDVDRYQIQHGEKQILNKLFSNTFDNLTLNLYLQPTLNNAMMDIMANADQIYELSSYKSEYKPDEIDLEKTKDYLINVRKKLVIETLEKNEVERAELKDQKALFNEQLDQGEYILNNESRLDLNNQIFEVTNKIDKYDITIDTLYDLTRYIDHNVETLSTMRTDSFSDNWLSNVMSATVNKFAVWSGTPDDKLSSKELISLINQDMIVTYNRLNRHIEKSPYVKNKDSLIAEASRVIGDIERDPQDTLKMLHDINRRFHEKVSIPYSNDVVLQDEIKYSSLLTQNYLAHYSQQIYKSVDSVSGLLSYSKHMFDLKNTIGDRLTDYKQKFEVPPVTEEMFNSVGQHLNLEDDYIHTTDSDYETSQRESTNKKETAWTDLISEYTEIGIDLYKKFVKGAIPAREKLKKDLELLRLEQRIADEDENLNYNQKRMILTNIQDQINDSINEIRTIDKLIVDFAVKTLKKDLPQNDKASLEAMVETLTKTDLDTLTDLDYLTNTDIDTAFSYDVAYETGFGGPNDKQGGMSEDPLKPSTPPGNDILSTLTSQKSSRRQVQCELLTHKQLAEDEDSQAVLECQLKKEIGYDVGRIFDDFNRIIIEETAKETDINRTGIAGDVPSNFFTYYHIPAFRNKLTELEVPTEIQEMISSFTLKSTKETVEGRYTNQQSRFYNKMLTYNEEKTNGKFTYGNPYLLFLLSDVSISKADQRRNIINENKKELSQETREVKNNLEVLATNINNDLEKLQEVTGKYGIKILEDATLDLNIEVPNSAVDDSWTGWAYSALKDAVNSLGIVTGSSQIVEALDALEISFEKRFFDTDVYSQEKIKAVSAKFGEVRIAMNETQASSIDMSILASTETNVLKNMNQQVNYQEQMRELINSKSLKIQQELYSEVYFKSEIHVPVYYAPSISEMTDQFLAGDVSDQVGWENVLDKIPDFHVNFNFKAKSIDFREKKEALKQLNESQE